MRPADRRRRPRPVEIPWTLRRAIRYRELSARRVESLCLLLPALVPAHHAAAQQPTMGSLPVPESERTLTEGLRPAWPGTEPRHVPPRDGSRGGLAAGDSTAAGQTHPALLTGAALLGGTAGFFAGGLVGGGRGGLGRRRASLSGILDCRKAGQE